MIKPIGNKIIIKKGDEETLESGIVLASDVGTTEKGIVVACGMGKKLDNGTVIPMTVKEGDEVLFLKSIASDINYDKEEKDHYIISEDDVLAILN